MNLAEIRTTKMFLTLQPDLDHASGGGEASRRHALNPQ